MLQKSSDRLSVDSSSAEYMDFEKTWEKKHKSDGSKDFPKFGASDFKYITVLGKGSFGKVRSDASVYSTRNVFLNCVSDTLVFIFLIILVI